MVDNDKHGSRRFQVLIILCVTVIALGSIGSWVYVQEQNNAQRDRALLQQKQLEEYQQQQLNQRNDADNSVTTKNAECALRPTGRFC